jgi:hypothetical protein
MADELHTPNHRWYEPRNHIPLAKEDVSKQWIYDSGIQKIDAFIAAQPWGGPRVLFIPSGSDSLIDANGDTFKVREA